MENQHSLLTIDQPVRIHLVGKFRVYGIDNLDITPTATKARCLLAVLIVENSGAVSREKISQLLWSRHAHQQARASLRQSLSILRRIFDKFIPGFISADRNNIYVQLNKVWVDAKKSIDGAIELSPLLDRFNGEVLGELNANDPEFSHWLALNKRSLQKEIKHALARDLSSNIGQEQSDEASTLNSCGSATPAFMHQQSENSGNHTGAEITVEKRRVNDLSLYRTSLLKKVKAFWVDGLLAHSLNKKPVIALALKEAPECLHQPWGSIVPQPHRSTRLFPSKTPIIDIFEELHENMLILGAPGSGKTTLLLNLAKKTLERAEENEHMPIPVVLHLSTWSSQYTDLGDWLIDELENRYQMPRQLSAEMISDHALLLLLDGLDEVNVECQMSCIQALNKFQNQPRPVGMAICSREGDYTNCSPPLALKNAVVIQPLSSKQLDHYLQTISVPSYGLHAAVTHNSEIKTLLTTPLMLSIATTAYKNYHGGDFLKESSKNTLQDQLFSAYVQAMFQRRNKHLPYSPAQATHWLGCLARTLIDKKQSLFYLDGIQPDWAGTTLQRWIISRGSIYICGIIVILTLSLLSKPLFGMSTNLPLFLTVGFVGCYLTARWGYGDKIKPVARIRLSLNTLRYKLSFKLISSAVLATTFGGGAALLLNPVISITLGIFFFLLLIVTNSLDFERLKHHSSQPSVPNEAIHISLYNALAGLTLGSALGATAGLFTGDLKSVISTSVTLGVISGLFLGGHACIQHYLLRYFLWRNKTAPLRYTPFLAFAVRRAFLYRVGSGYLFIHRSLAEYFAKNL
ncbi:MAG: NACHT domain-containing protein [Gammaproteobacteria bacterium]|nr:NACHT domain-containing protein [Gammaproteobacteria bacterium]